MTGNFTGVAVKDFKGPANHNSRSQSTDLAKLNPYCQMNYSIIFTVLRLITCNR